MKASSLALLILFGLAAVVQAETRTWTDQRGRTLEGEMVRVVDDAVEIRMESKTVTVKLSMLSEADQDFVRQAAATTPEPAIEEDGPAEGPTEFKIARRDWLVGDKKVRGKFVKYDDGDVSISTASRQVKHPYSALSPADQEYVCDVLESRGELEQIPETNWSDKHRRAKLERLRAETQRQIDETNAQRDAERRAEELRLANEQSRAESQRLAEERRLAREQAAQEAATTSAPPITPTAPMSPTLAVAPPIGTPPASPSKDAWDQDLEVMQNSNRNAYYFLGGVLGFLLVFGPIAYALQRAR